jgi:hypothetical protein
MDTERVVVAAKPPPAFRAADGADNLPAFQEPETINPVLVAG